MRMSITSELGKPIEKWSNKDFVFYFSNRLFMLTGKKLDIPPVAWAGFVGRVKGFKKNLDLDNAQYKDFIDAMFDRFSSNMEFVPSFGAIVSEKLYHVIKKYRMPLFDSNADFEKLRKELYADNILFQRL